MHASYHFCIIETYWNNGGTRRKGAKNNTVKHINHKTRMNLYHIGAPYGSDSEGQVPRAPLALRVSHCDQYQTSAVPVGICHCDVQINISGA